jgi:hypothetical protein
MSRAVRWGPSLLGAVAALLVGWSGGAAAQQQPGQSRDGKDRRVEIINATNVVVNSFYASNVDRTQWEEDLLGRDVLAPGKRVRANIDDGTGACLFDFKVVFADGRSMEDRSVNVCQIASWTITPQGPRRQLPQQRVPPQQVPQERLPPLQDPPQQVPPQAPKERGSRI